jgi:hypothetical protein
MKYFNRAYQVSSIKKQKEDTDLEYKQTTMLRSGRLKLSSAMLTSPVFGGRVEVSDHEEAAIRSAGRA